MFEASAGGDVVGLDLWYVHGDVAYGHLAAFSDLGYGLGASYATKWAMLHHFSGRVRWVDLSGDGSGPGRERRSGRIQDAAGAPGRSRCTSAGEHCSRSAATS